MAATQSPLINAVIDLGSNSFHLILFECLQGQPKVRKRVKRKVRLAAGLDDHGCLSLESMQRGWDCLEVFASHLQYIPAQRIMIVATAALRAASNSDEFVERAETILGQPVRIISGQEEAQTIYYGLSCTEPSEQSRLVIDIGGASTELIIGTGTQIERAVSLEMGCVSWLEKYFKEKQVTADAFQQAVSAAQQQVAPIVEDYLAVGWQHCVGASGIVQALREICIARQRPTSMTASELNTLADQVMRCSDLMQLRIAGLSRSRTLLFPSGLAILLGLFQSLQIAQLSVATGALREGLMFKLIESQQAAISIG